MAARPWLWVSSLLTLSDSQYTSRNGGDGREVETEWGGERSKMDGGRLGERGRAKGEEVGEEERGDGRRKER